ncbi:hypothetical protein [Lactovum odontotermitis]
MTDEEKEKVEENIYKFGADISKVSYEMELQREKRIDSKFEKLTIFVSLMLGVLGFFANQTNILARLDEKPILILVFIVFSSFSAVLIMSLIGQFYFKQEYIKNGEIFTSELKSNIEAYSEANAIEKQTIYQISDVQKSLEKVSNRRRTILKASQILLIVITIILFLVGLLNIIFS